MSLIPDIDAQLDEAIARHEARDLDRAERLYRSVLEQQPDHPEALSLLGLILQDRGEIEASIGLIARALEIEPDFPEALANLARGHNFRGEPEAAARAARRATELDPDLGEGWLQLGRALLDLGENEAALPALREASSHFPGSVEIYAGIGTAAQRLRQWKEAEEAWRIVLEAMPDRLDGLVNLAAACCELDETDEALPLVRRARQLAPEDFDVMCALAATLHKRNDAAELVPICREILAREPARADILAMMASGQMWLGQFPDAIATAEAALAVDPDHVPARYLLGRLRPESLDGATIKRFRRLLADPGTSLPDRGQAAYSIAAALDDAGNYGGAFELYQTANTSYREHGKTIGNSYNVDEFRGYIDWVRASFPPSKFASFQGLGNPSELPVFIVGLPRSGTSLVEQIAASHPRVHGAGELLDVAKILRRINQVPAYIPIERWERERVKHEADQQIERLTALGGDADRVIDKMPDNIKVLGQIRLLFPNARIIICHRDPRDVCVSCFTTPFGDGLNWAWDIEDCARQVLETRRLSNFWRSVLPGPVMEIQYETLVANVEQESRRLIAFLDLDWDPACLEFYKTERKVTTASALQVRRPLFTSGLAKWRRYEAHLGPMLRILEDYPYDEPAPEADALRYAAELRAAGKQRQAIEALRAAASEFPAAHEVHAELARALGEAGDHSTAVITWRNALAVQPNNPGYWRALAAALWAQRDVDGTRDAYKRALTISPENNTTLRALGDFETMFGHFDEAAEYYRRVIDRSPGAMAARLGLLFAGKTDEAGDLDDFRFVLNDHQRSLDDRVMAGWALGKALDAQAEYDEAFRVFQSVNALLRDKFAAQSDQPDITTMVNRLIEAFPAELFRDAASWGEQSELPVFIVGLPRTGTSLVEQILASHPKVFGAGERKDILASVDAIDAADHGVNRWNPAVIRREGTTEVERLRKLSQSSLRVIDKLPGNIFWLGYIRLMLPRARIIVCRRDPRDVGLSCYTTIIYEAQKWAYDLNSIARQILEVERITAHWRDVLPGPYIEVQYENLVRNLEGESRRLIEFLGLEWDPACLDFYRTERAINTVSVSQVRQKLYDHSIGRWRLYQRHLSPLLDGVSDLVTHDENEPMPATIAEPGAQ